MITTIIVEDDPLDASALLSMLGEFKESLTVLAVCSNVKEAYDSIIKHNPSLVFLDIELELGEKGFDLIRLFKKPNFSVVFTTHHSSQNNMLSAIRVCALDFLSKPVLKPELSDAILRFQEKDNSEGTKILSENIEKGIENPHWIILSSTDGKTILERDNIIYAKSKNVYTTFYLASSVHSKYTYLSSRNLKKWETDLINSDIVRIHNEYLVNLKFCEKVINKISGGAVVILKNKIKLPVSRSRRKELMNRLKREF